MKKASIELFSELVSYSYRGQMILPLGRCSLEHAHYIRRSVNNTNSISNPHQTVAEMLLFILHGYTVYQHGRTENLMTEGLAGNGILSLQSVLKLILYLKP